MLQSVEVCCSALQCVAVFRAERMCLRSKEPCILGVRLIVNMVVCYSALQRVVVCCSVLQCVAVCCIVLHCVSVCCSVYRVFAKCCRVLQCVAMCCGVPCVKRASLRSKESCTLIKESHFRSKERVTVLSVLQCVATTTNQTHS